METEQQLVPAGRDILNNDYAWLTDRLTDLMTLMTVSATHEQIERWQQIVIRQVADMPRYAVSDALDAALRVCRFPNEVVPFITAEVERTTAPIRKHLRILRVMVDSVQIAGNV